MGNIGIPNGIEGGTSNGTTGRFEDQKTITKVEFGKNCTFVGRDAFENCTSLTEINDDNVLEKIGSNAFAGTAITSAKFDSLTTLESGAFEGCTELKSISIPKVKEIPDIAFYNCTNLSEIKLDNCISIGNAAFESCENLQKINLYKCENIGYRAFLYCINLKRVYIHKNDFVCELGTNAFNENTIFFIHPDIFDKYNEDEMWWKDYPNKVKMVLDNQIIYTTTNNELISINADNVKSNKYENGYGLIEFNENVKVETLNNNIFALNTKLESVILPESCKVIGDSAFNGCTSLSDITLLGSLTKIGNFAFKNCVSLKSFEIPQSIKTLGIGVFAGCTGITQFNINDKFVTYDGKAIVCNGTLICVLSSDDSIKLNISDIDENITTLGNYCFYGCENLKRIDIPSSITTICENAFDECENLQEIHFLRDTPPKLNYDITTHSNLKIFVPEENISEYYEVWENVCTKKTSNIYPMPKDKNIIWYGNNSNKISLSSEEKTNKFNSSTYHLIENKKTQIPKNCFSESSVKEVIIGESISEIEEGAFSDCSSLEYIYLPDNVSKIRNVCFENCTNLTKIHIPFGKNGCNFGTNIFCGCTKLQKFETYKKGNVSDDGRCYIENNELKFFAPNNLKTDYTIPSGVTSIRSYAFSSCYSLTSVSIHITIPDSVTSIGTYAFCDCDSLTSVTFSDKCKITSISDYSFASCGLTSVTIPNSVKTIGKRAFSHCKSLTSIAIPDSVTEIGDAAFNYCTSLTSVTIPKDVTSIENYTFSNCIKLTSVTIPIDVTSIGNDAFRSCTALTDIAIPDKVNSIGEFAFIECNSLKSVTIPDGVTSIGRSTFYGCNSLTSVTIPDSVASIGTYAFFSCDSLTSITIGNGVTSIGEGAFCSCSLLINVTIGYRVTSIGYRAFSSCSSLTSITIPISVTSIGDSAFRYCTSLTSVYCKPTTPPTGGSYMFDDNADDRQIYVPSRTQNVYKNANNWMRYKDYISADMSIVDVILPGKPGGLEFEPKV